MDVLKNLTVEMEMDKHGSLFSTNDTKALRINHSSTYPVTHGIVNEFKKAVSKELLKVLKQDSMNHLHTMVTVYGYNYSYETVNLHRFTFERYDGKIHVETRPYNTALGYEVKDTIAFDTDKQARDFMVEEIVKYVKTYIDVKENKDNYFTSNMWGGFSPLIAKYFCYWLASGKNILEKMFSS